MTLGPDAGDDIDESGGGSTVEEGPEGAGADGDDEAAESGFWSDDGSTGTWIAVGIAIGVALGAAFDNVAMGLAIGLAIGSSQSDPG